MDLKLAGKTALITGASKGIGRAAAEAFAREGCNVVLVSRTASDLNTVAASIARINDIRVDTFPADLSDGRNVEHVASAYPKIDILVNNAGAIPGGTLLEIKESRWRAGWDLKVFGYINMCRAYYTLMRARRSGVIINVIGISAETREPEYICGVTGNAALTAFTRSLGSGSSRDGIRVLGINPGPVSTDRLTNFLQTKAQEKTGDPGNWLDLLAPLPFGRAAMPDEIAAAIAFLASEHSAYSSGSIFAIDGGISSRAQAV